MKLASLVFGFAVIIGCLGILTINVNAEGGTTSSTTQAPSGGTTCSPSKGAGAVEFLPTWYQYLKGEYSNGKCQIAQQQDGSVVVLVMLAVINILLWLASIVAVIFVVWGGFMFVSSQGSPDKIASARKTILNAIIGLIIALLASQLVKFVAHFLST